jgi:lipoprotein-releasing system permease protein
MSEYDSNFVFVPIEALQRMRGMIDPQTGIPSVNSIQIRLKPDAKLNEVRDRLREVFPSDLYAIATWRDKQGPLLSAVDMEMAVLNILLFLIIAVAGFGILAIFFMIVVEKTRDIGILKALGATSSGIAGIFLGYGLFLGLLGAGAGLVLGLSITYNINHFSNTQYWIIRINIFNN